MIDGWTMRLQRFYPRCEILAIDRSKTLELVPKRQLQLASTGAQMALSAADWSSYHVGCSAAENTPRQRVSFKIFDAGDRRRGKTSIFWTFFFFFQMAISDVLTSATCENGRGWFY